MTTPMRNHMRRHTRPAGYVSKSRQAAAMVYGRPGGRSFSFTGEFPGMDDQQPVEATGRRRNYTAGTQTGSYQAIRRDDTARMPVINKFGVHIVTAMMMLAVVLVMMGSVLWGELDDLKRLQSSIAAKEDRINVLEVECSNTKAAIAAQSDDVNIRQEAVRMGLISSKGVKVHYLEVPQDAVITSADPAAVQGMAIIWGR